MMTTDNMRKSREYRKIRFHIWELLNKKYTSNFTHELLLAKTTSHVRPRELEGLIRRELLQKGIFMSIDIYRLAVKDMFQEDILTVFEISKDGKLEKPKIADDISRLLLSPTLFHNCFICFSSEYNLV